MLATAKTKWNIINYKLNIKNKIIKIIKIIIKFNLISIVFINNSLLSCDPIT